VALTGETALPRGAQTDAWSPPVLPETGQGSRRLRALGTYYIRKAQSPLSWFPLVSLTEVDFRATLGRFGRRSKGILSFARSGFSRNPEINLGRGN
jgi:hypothetical protein